QEGQLSGPAVQNQGAAQPVASRVLDPIDPDSRAADVGGHGASRRAPMRAACQLGPGADCRALSNDGSRQEELLAIGREAGSKAARSSAIGPSRSLTRERRPPATARAA